MRFSTIATAIAPIVTLASAQGAPGYAAVTPTIPESNSTLSFGSHYAVLNFDMINALVGSVDTTANGKAWVSSVSSWISAVHAHPSHPLQIFTRIWFNDGHPEIGATTPFAQAVGGLIDATYTNPLTEIYPAFNPDPAGYLNGTSKDVVIRKNRYDATYNSELTEILIAQKIDTVVISGIRTSGVVLSTIYTLFDLGYNIYVISNNSIETPSNTPNIDGAIKNGILPKLPVNVITLDLAKAALARSG